MSARLDAAAPLRAVDAVEVVSPTEVVGVKQVVATDPYLPGHYPGLPIYPGVFVAETARQAVVELLARTRGGAWTAAIQAVSAARFMAPLLAGDTLRATVRCESTRADGLAASVRCEGSDGTPVATLSLRLSIASVSVVDAAVAWPSSVEARDA